MIKVQGFYKIVLIYDQTHSYLSKSNKHYKDLEHITLLFLYSRETLPFSLKFRICSNRESQSLYMNWSLFLCFIMPYISNIKLRNPFTLQWLQNQWSNTNYCLKLQICSSVEESVRCPWYLSCSLDINVVFLVSIFSFSFFSLHCIVSNLLVIWNVQFSEWVYTEHTTSRIFYCMSCH